jgi:hypothetical protein
MTMAKYPKKSPFSLKPFWVEGRQICFDHDALSRMLRQNPGCFFKEIPDALSKIKVRKGGIA